MSKIPKQIEEAAELAEQLHKEMMQPPEEEQAPEEETAPPPEDEEEDTYRQRYQSLKGKYDAEVPRLHQELETFKQQVFERLGKEQPKETTPPPADEKLEKFKEQYGDELLEYINYFAEQKAKELIPQSVQPVQEQVASMEQAQMQAAQQNFMEYLDQKTEGKWRKLWSGEDQKFLDFLQQPDPSGLYTYGDLVSAYNDRWDADKLVKVFDAYWGNGPAKPKPANPAKEAMIAPSRQPSQSTPNVAEKRIWTQDMIRDFQTADRQKKYQPEESKAMWDDLLAALGENRIR